jgi:opacity protein-like surface antigen
MRSNTHYLFSRLLSFAILSLLMLPCSEVLGQRGVQPSVDRDEYFRRLEERALKLSGKFAEISGTQPVKLFEARQPQDKAKKLPSFNSPYPGFSDSGFNATSMQSEFTTDFNGTDVGAKNFIDEEVIEYQPTMEDKRGQYFLRPFIALQANGDQKLKTLLPDLTKIDSHIGYSLGLHAGTRVQDFNLGIRFAYHYNEFSKSTTSNSLEGENELLSLLVSGGYSVSLREELTLELGAGLGFSNRFNFALLEIGNVVLDPISSDKTVFTYDFSILLDYAYTENLSAFAGYRFVGVSKNGSFDRYISHLFELGLAASF